MSLGLNVKKASKAVARARAIEMYGKGELAPARQGSSLTVGEFAKELFDGSNGLYLKRRIAMGRPLSGNYTSSLSYHVKRLEPLGGERLCDLTRKKIETFMFALLDTNASKTVRSTLATLHLILREGIKYGYIHADPMYDFDLPSKAPRVKRDRLSPEEIRKLFFAGDQSDIWKGSILYRTAALLSLSTGMRKGEILALHGSEVHREHLEVKYSWSASEGLKPPKNGYTRIVPLTPLLYAELETLREMRGNGLLFSLDNQKPINLKTLSDAFVHALDKIKISEAVRKSRNLSFHCLRVTYNSAMVAYRVQEAILRSIVGHTDQEMTDRYLAPNPSDLKVAREAATAFLEDLRKEKPDETEK